MTPFISDDDLLTKFYIPQIVTHQEQIFKSCYELANNVCSSKKTTIIIVEGASGMGKTRYLEEIQRHIRSEKPHWWTVNLNLRNFRNDFASNLSTTSQAVSLVASKLKLGDLEKQDFEEKARKELVIYLFDDLDQIDLSKLEIVLEIFGLLGKVIVTTKPFTEI
jgi:Cdc6-like AAA superfamily ATPase